jgi:hypothetical protein
MTREKITFPSESCSDSTVRGFPPRVCRTSSCVFTFPSFESTTFVLDSMDGDESAALREQTHPCQKRTLYPNKRQRHGNTEMSAIFRGPHDHALSPFSVNASPIDDRTIRKYPLTVGGWEETPLPCHMPCADLILGHKNSFCLLRRAGLMIYGGKYLHT